MTEYTIGAMFTATFNEILLIHKLKPAWQTGHMNFPGGKIEDGESPFICIAREFQEETNIYTAPSDWQYIGVIEGKDYRCHFLTCILNSKDQKERTKSLTYEPVEWIGLQYISHTPYTLISNLHWLIPFAVNYWKQGNADNLTFGTFKYD